MSKQITAHTEFTPVRAAEYVRMSTEHQQYSTENQREVIRDYAARRNMDIVRTYADEGKSGLSLEGRDSLKQLIADVQSGKAEYQVILVYDVSRWGRFQDADEAAFYEYICKERGIRVHYCAEMFENDDSLPSAVIKSMKRVMAGEYSRELSAKVFKGQCRLIELGYRQGGPAGFGLRRMRIDQHGNHLGILEKGQYKSLQTDRVILVPGPDAEVEAVRYIYRLFVDERKSEREIAELLNIQNIKGEHGRPWSRGTVHQLIINEKYIGNNIFNRTSFKLKKKRVKNNPEMWIRGAGAFSPLVDLEKFLAASRIIQDRDRKLSNEEMIELLKGLFLRHGRISGLLIDESENLPSSGSYKARFGSLIRVYSLIGYTPNRDFQYIEDNRKLRRLYPEIIEEIIGCISEVGGYVERPDKDDILLVNDELRVCVVLARCRRTSSGSYRWSIKLEDRTCPDITIAIRMDHENLSVQDYYLFPWIELTTGQLKLAEYNGLALDGYRYDDLGFFFSLLERIRIGGAA